MGRIKTVLVKRITRDLVKAHRQDFKTEFEANKEIVRRYASIPSNKLRNIIAGYVTRILRQKQEIKEI
ncbi:30S ribosomal protein S17e [Candidatus Woesearchaeota archaeon]|nr:30S ribosomal protein S17e [Candidatus Woesearchaeota archaeon]